MPTEAELVARSVNGPVTVKMMVEHLRRLGVKPGMTLIVHSSLSALGWVCGGPQAVILALQQALTQDGTLIMPTYTGWNSDPATWRKPPVPKEWIDIIREEMPAYDPAASTSKYMGAIPEAFRSQTGVIRSAHPRASFAAWGKNAHAVIDNHSLDFPFGPNTPVSRAYALKAYLLLLGAPYDTINSWYYSAYLADQKELPVETCYAAMMENGKRVWKAYKDHSRRHDDFEAIGAAFEKTGRVTVGTVGYAASKLMSQVEIVDFGADWMKKNRVF